MRAPLRPASASLIVALAATGLGCQESGFDEAKETARPLKVQHAHGETKVPGQAERPMTLTLDTLDDTLALRVRPVRAAVPGGRLPAYLRRPATGISLMPPLSASDLTAVEAAHADLIVGRESAQGAFYDELSRIAPTVMTDGGGGQWKLNLRLVGEALGRTNDAEQLLTVYDREAALTRRAIGAAGRRARVAVARVTAGGLRYAQLDSFAGTILADLGVKQATSDAQGADVVLLSGAAGATASVDGRVERAVEAVWWGSGGALAARAALRDVEAALAR